MSAWLLFPLGFAWGVAPCLLLHTLIVVAHVVLLSMHTLTLGHHSSKSTSVWKHFVLSTYTSASTHARWYQILLLFLRSMVLLVLGLMLHVLTILLLTLNINWWLRSDSVLWWSRAWFLGVGPMLLIHHLSIIHVCLILSTMGDTTTHEVVVLLYKTEWIWWWSIVMATMHHVLLVC